MHRGTVTAGRGGGGEVCHVNVHCGNGPSQREGSNGRGGETGDTGWRKQRGSKGNGKEKHRKREANTMEDTKASRVSRLDILERGSWRNLCYFGGGR